VLAFMIIGLQDLQRCHRAGGHPSWSSLPKVNSDELKQQLLPALINRAWDRIPLPEYRVDRLRLAERQNPAGRGRVLW